MFAAESKVATAPIGDEARFAAVNSWKQIIDPVEPFLEAVNRRLVQQVETFDSELVSYADYALNGHGKHLRPALVALAAAAGVLYLVLGGDPARLEKPGEIGGRRVGGIQLGERWQKQQHALGGHVFDIAQRPARMLFGFACCDHKPLRLLLSCKPFRPHL